MAAESAPRLSKKRAERIARHVAPLVARGLTCYEIGERLGISHVMAASDMKVCKGIWAGNLREDLEGVRSEGVARYETLYRDCLEGHEAAKREGRTTEKFLLAAARILDQKHKLQGLVTDIALVQNTLNVHGQATQTEVLSAFAPLDPNDYQALIEQQGGFTQLPPVPDKPVVEGDELPLEVVPEDNTAWPAGETPPELDRPAAKQQTGFKRVPHPLGRI